MSLDQRRLTIFLFASIFALSSVSGVFTNEKHWRDRREFDEDGKLTEDPFGIGAIPEAGMYLIRAALWNVINYIWQTIVYCKCRLLFWSKYKHVVACGRY